MLSVRDLRTAFISSLGEVVAVDGVSFDVSAGRVVALVGESGCGKSATAMSILRLLPSNARITGGTITLGDQNLVQAGDDELRRIRGRRIGMVFQEPAAALNPVMSIGRQVGEVVALHLGLRGQALENRVHDVMVEAALPDAARVASMFPHQLSGGMRQRTMIAIAIAGDPDLIIADEPTTALDVTIQRQILDLLKRLVTPNGASTHHRERPRALLLITHDFGVVRAIADDVVVMYAGRVVETGPTSQILARPMHPYTRALLACVPSLRRRSSTLPIIPGTVPTPGEFPSGCRFHPRCELGLNDAKCSASDPPLESVGAGRLAACWKSGT